MKWTHPNGLGKSIERTRAPLVVLKPEVWCEQVSDSEPFKSSLGPTRSQNHGDRFKLALAARRRLADSDNLGAVVQDVFRQVGLDLASRCRHEADDSRLDRDLGDGHGFAREHRLVDDRVAREEDHVGGKGVQVFVREVDQVARDERGRVVDGPCGQGG